jgi:hypothetical protein
MGYSATDRRLRCGSHTLNLIGQRLLSGPDTDAYDNDARELAIESEF